MEALGVVGVWILRIPALLIAITVHEFMHGMVAFWFGDRTARDQGRLSLNPIRHLDPIGALMLMLVGFGWAKPVPVNPYSFNKPVKHMMLVALAGPASNFIAAFMFARFLFFEPAGFIGGLLGQIIFINVMLGVFNLIPIPPLDGSKVVPYFLPQGLQQSWYKFEQYGFVVLLLVVFLGQGILWSIMKYPVMGIMRFVMLGLPYNL